MRSHAKASTAGSTQRQANGLGRFFRGALATRGASLDAKGSGAPTARRLAIAVLAAILAAMALVAAPASAIKTHPFKEIFGAVNQPSFSLPRGLAVDQSTGDVLVMDTSARTINRYKPNGLPDNFSALGTYVINGEDTPQNEFGFAEAGESQIAVDNSGTATDGNIYVTQTSPNLINIFSKTGAYLGQLTAAGATSFTEVCGVAVDPSGAVYVGDYSSGIHKFVPSANPPLNTDNTANFNSTTNPCALAAGAGPTAGFLFAAQYYGPISKLDSSTGELKYQVSPEATTLTVDPSTGHVFVAASSTVKEFNASGGSATSVSSIEAVNWVEGIAVNGASGDIHASHAGFSNLEVFGPAVVILPDVTTAAATGNTGAKATLNGTVNPDGVELTECKFEYGKTTSYGQTVPCAESPATIGTGTSPVAVHADISGLAPNGTAYNFRLVAANANGAVKGLNQNFATPNTVITTAASALTPSSATLNGTVNPDGAMLSDCKFEYGTSASYGETVPCVPDAAGIGTGTSPVAVHADIGGLHPGTVYHYRLVATYAAGAIKGADITSQTVGPAIKGTWSEDVVFTEAVIKAEINPEGKATTYRFEWGTSTAYGNPTPESGAGSDNANHEVGVFLEGLQPGTTYHYRVVATNADAVNESPDHTFTTYAHTALDISCANQDFRVGPGARLADCRGYEMVSPVDKHGGNAFPPFCCGSSGNGYFEQASLSGEKITYTSDVAFGDQHSGANANQYIATRGPSGWSNHGINPPFGVTVFEFLEAFGSPSPPHALDSPFQAFSEDLSSAWVINANKIPLTPQAAKGFGNLYQRDNLGGGFETLTVSPPTSYYEEGEFGTFARGLRIEFRGASADEGDQFFDLRGALTPDASPTKNRQIYDFAGGDLHLVSVLPNGTAASGDSWVGSFGNMLSTTTIGTNSRKANVKGAISEDGSRVFWTGGAPEEGFSEGLGKVYLRQNPTQPQSALNGAGECTEPAKACTIRVSESVSAEPSRYWAANTDGSKVIFSVGAGAPKAGEIGTGGHGTELYEFDVETETPSLIAGDVRGVLGVSDDLSRVYFASEEALDAGASEGEWNLYLDEEGAMTFIATLSASDVETSDITSAVHPSPIFHSGMVTPDGGRIAFMSDRPLTGYDNTDANSGEADKEVFTYEVGGELICASCNPSGARPKGHQMSRPYFPGQSFFVDPWAGAWIPSWGHETQPPRVLSDDGDRLFFNSYDALLPSDNNGKQDVYQWEALGSGGCQKAGGCVSLISAGESAKTGKEDEFIDASASGDDVFFRTSFSINPRDIGSIDIYDARVGGGDPPPPSPPECVGDACQNIPPAPNDPTPASAGFHGAGSPPAKKPRRSCRARHAGKSKSHAKRHKKAKRCKRAKRGAGR